MASEPSMSSYYYVYNYRVDGNVLRLQYTRCHLTDAHKLEYSPGELSLSDINDLYYVYPIETDEVYAAFEEALRTTHFCLVKDSPWCANGRFANAAQPIAFAYDPRPDRACPSASDARRDWVLVQDLQRQRPMEMTRQEAIEERRSELLQQLRFAYAELPSSSAPSVSPDAYQICGPAPDLAWSFRHYCAIYNKYEACAFPTWIKMPRTPGEEMSLRHFLSSAIPVSTHVREGTEKSPAWLPAIPRLRVLRISDQKNAFKADSIEYLQDPTGGIDLDYLGDSSGLAAQRRIPRVVVPSETSASAPATGASRYDMVILRCPRNPYKYCAPPNNPGSGGHRRPPLDTTADRMALIRQYVRRVLDEHGISFNMCMAYNIRLVPIQQQQQQNRRGSTQQAEYERSVYQGAVYKARLTGVAWETLMLPSDAVTEAIMPLCEGAIGHALYRAGYHILPGARLKERAAVPGGHGSILHAGTSELYTPPGLYGEGLHLDVKSYYPNIIREARCCYTNPVFWEKRHPVTGATLTTADYVRQYAIVVEPMYARVAESLQGEYRTRAPSSSLVPVQHPMPLMMNMLLSAREIAGKDCPTLADALKLVANAIYGSWAYPGARFPAVPLAAVVGHLGQRWLAELTDAARSCAASRYAMCMSITDSLTLCRTASDADADANGFMKRFSEIVTRRFEYIRVTRDDFSAAFFHARGCYAFLRQMDEEVHQRGFVHRHFSQHLSECLCQLLKLILSRGRSVSAADITALLERYHLTSSAIPPQWQLTGAAPLHEWQRSLKPVVCSITPAFAKNTKRMQLFDTEGLESASLVPDRYAGVVVVRNPGTPEDPVAVAASEYTIVNDVSMDGMEDAPSNITDTREELCLVPVVYWHARPHAYRLAWREWYLKECILPVLRDKILQHLDPDVDSQVMAAIPEDLLQRKSRSARHRQQQQQQETLALSTMLDDGMSFVSSVMESEAAPPQVYATCYKCQEQVRVDPMWRHASSGGCGGGTDSSRQDALISDDFAKSEVDPVIFSLTSSASIDIVRCGNCRELLSAGPQDRQRIAIKSTDNDRPAQQRAEFMHLYTYFNTVQDAAAGLPGPSGLNLNKEAESILATRIENSPYNAIQW